MRQIREIPGIMAQAAPYFSLMKNRRYNANDPSG
jgi:hypothetical protein